MLESHTLSQSQGLPTAKKKLFLVSSGMLHTLPVATQHHREA